MAAATGGGTIYVYQPPAKKGGHGGVVPVSTGPVVHGLEAAQIRLQLIVKSANLPVNGAR
jgi:hypothetical protein